MKEAAVKAAVELDVERADRDARRAALPSMFRRRLDAFEKSMAAKLREIRARHVRGCGAHRPPLPRRGGFRRFLCSLYLTARSTTNVRVGTALGAVAMFEVPYAPVLASMLYPGP